MNAHKHKAELACSICGKLYRPSQLRPVELVSEPLQEQLARAFPQWDHRGYVCLADIGQARLALMREALSAGKGELAHIEEEVVASLLSEETLARNIAAEYARRLSFGERVSDRLAAFGGSWRFIFIFLGIMCLWIVANSLAWLHKPFDPFPFILLNLVLSCLAAIQAPVIMMSQNRQESKDRAHFENDYRVNLKAELEIRSLHSKLDLLISHQWQRLLEIQQVQTEMIEELTERGGLNRRLPKPEA